MRRLKLAELTFEADRAANRMVPIVLIASSAVVHLPLLNFKSKPIEHTHYIDMFGQDMSEIRNWKWDAAHSSKAS